MVEIEWFHVVDNTKYEANLVIIPHVLSEKRCTYFDLINRSSSGARLKEWIWKLRVYISSKNKKFKIWTEKSKGNSFQTLAHSYWLGPID